MADVRLEGLSKRFGDVVALDDLSLEVKDGELVSLLGPSLVAFVQNTHPADDRLTSGSLVWVSWDPASLRPIRE